MIGLLAEMHWHPSMALGREEEIEKRLAAFVTQLYPSESNTAQATRKEDDEAEDDPTTQ